MPSLQKRILRTLNLSCSSLCHFQLLMCRPQNRNEYTNIHLLNPFYWGLWSKEQYTTFGSARPARKHMQASHLGTEWDTENLIRNKFLQRMWEIYLGSWWGPHNWLVVRIQTGFSIWKVLQQFSCCNPAPCNHWHHFTRGPLYCQSAEVNICKHGHVSTEMKHLSKQKRWGKPSTCLLLWCPWTMSQVLMFSPLTAEPRSHLPNQSSTRDSSPSQCLPHGLYFVMPDFTGLIYILLTNAYTLLRRICLTLPLVNMQPLLCVSFTSSDFIISSPQTHLFCYRNKWTFPFLFRGWGEGLLVLE